MVVFPGRLVALALLAFAVPAAADTTLFVIADTGDCATDGTAQVAAAIRRQPDWREGWLVEVGDLAYPTATAARLAECHEPHFSMFPKRLAAPGNHDWNDINARGFFSVFPEPVPRAARLDARWQLWLLDSNLDGADWRRQLEWIDDAAARKGNACVIAAWHHPRWSSGAHGDRTFTTPLWQRVAGIASFTLHGHDHHYEALPPLDAAGAPDPRGTRSFIAGIGGARLYAPGAVARSGTAVFAQWGFLRIDIVGERYNWKAFGVSDAVLDSGSATCL